MSALALQPWQWGVLAACYLLFFAAPALWMGRRARRDGEQALVWTALVLVGSFLGIIEYYEHRSIVQRRAKRATRAEKASATPEGIGESGTEAHDPNGRR